MNKATPKRGGTQPRARLRRALPWLVPVAGFLALTLIFMLHITGVGVPSFVLWAAMIGAGLLFLAVAVEWIVERAHHKP